MFEIDKYMHKPFFGDGCDKPRHEKPRYTMTEEVEHTARLMRETIERLLKFEERAKNELADLSKHLTADNVIFKNAMHEAWTTFLMEVKNEVNVFEGNIEADIRLFKTEIETNYANLADSLGTMMDEFETEYTGKLTDLTESLQAQYNSFVEAVNARCDAHNETVSAALTDYQQKLNTELNSFEQTVNATVANFTESMGNSMHEFRTSLEQTVTERLAAQDGKISDAEMYMRTNLTATVTTLIGDMHANGEFADIIEGEVFNDLETTIRSFDALSVKYFGAVGDGVTDDTTAFNLAFSLFGTKYNALVIPEGTYHVKSVAFPNNSVVFANNATLKRSEHDGSAFITFGTGSTVYGNLSVDGDKENATTENENGVQFRANCRSYGVITSCNNSKHGITVESNNTHNSLIAYNNGKTGTAAGDGNADGIYILNVHDVIIRNVTAYNNKRMGLTVTTFSPITNAPDPDYMGRVYISNVYAHDNVYKDVDIEAAKMVVLENVETVSSIAASNSIECVFRNCRTGGFYAHLLVDSVVEDFVISPVGTRNDIFYIHGNDNKIENIHLLDTATAYTGNTVVIKGTANANNMVRNIHIENGNNAFICENAMSCHNVKVDKANNRLRTVNTFTIPTDNFAVDNGKLTIYYTATIEGGNVGDMIINTNPVVTNGYIIDRWVCTSNGWVECRMYAAE